MHTYHTHHVVDFLFSSLGDLRFCLTLIPSDDATLQRALKVLRTELVSLEAVMEGMERSSVIEVLKMFCDLTIY